MHASNGFSSSTLGRKNLPLQGDVKGEMGRISVVGGRKKGSQILQGHLRNPQCCHTGTKKIEDREELFVNVGEV